MNSARGALRNGAPGGMTVFAPGHIHMNFIANNPDVMLRAQLRHGGQFVAAPDFARRVMRAA